MTIETTLDAIEFLTGQWARKPTEIGFEYTATDLANWTAGQIRDHARMIYDQLPKPTPGPSRTTPELTTKAAAFLAQNPTEIGTYPGGKFYEHPTRGDTAAIFTIGKFGQLIDTGFYDLGDPDDIQNAIDAANARWTANHPEAGQ